MARVTSPATGFSTFSIFFSTAVSRSSRQSAGGPLKGDGSIRKSSQCWRKRSARTPKVSVNQKRIEMRAALASKAFSARP